MNNDSPIKKYPYNQNHFNSSTYLYYLHQSGNEFENIGESNWKLEPSVSVYYSLQYYQKLINILKGQLKLITYYLNRQQIKSSFYKIVIYTQQPQTPSYAQGISESPVRKKSDEITQLIEDKIENYQIQQQNFIFNVEQLVDEEQLGELENINELSFTINNNRNLIYASEFQPIQKQHPTNTPNYPLQNNPIIIKGFLYYLSMLTQSKILQNKHFALSSLKSHLNTKKSSQQYQSIIHLKATKLLNLKHHSQIIIKHALRQWYLNSTQQGNNLFRKAVNNLVFYTNIHKYSFFYRLLKTIKKHPTIIKLTPQLKIITTMFYYYTKTFFQKIKRSIFQTLKTNLINIKNSIANKLISCSKKRIKHVIYLWQKQTQKYIQQDRLNKYLCQQYVRKIIIMEKQRKKISIRKWREIVRKEIKEREMKKRIFGKIVVNKAKNVDHAFNKIKNLQKLVKKEKKVKAELCVKKLKDFIDRTIKISYQAFKVCFDEGRSMQKWSIIHLLNIMKGKQKQAYLKWLGMTQHSLIINECILISDIFSNINFAIKSVADNAFLNSKNNEIKEKSLIRLFKNLDRILADTFNRWRNDTNIEQLRENIKSQQKSVHIRALQNFLRKSKNSELRQVIHKFRTLKKVSEIQRKFMKALIMSKIGMVVIAYRKIGSLPERRNNAISIISNKFEKELSLFVGRTLKKSFEAFRLCFNEGRSLQKWSIIHLLNITKGKKKQKYLKWFHINQLHILHFRYSSLTTLFSHLTKISHKNFSPLFSKPHYTLSSIPSLQNYFHKFCETTNQNLKLSIKQFVLTLSSQKYNPWFIRTALILSVYTKINVQKSLWRLKYNINSTQFNSDPNFIVKLKKMYNNIRKLYVLHMYRAFLSIDKYGHSYPHNSNKYQPLFPQLNSNSYTITNPNSPSLKTPHLLSHLRKTSLSLMSLVLKRILGKQLKKWHSCLLPTNRDHSKLNYEEIRRKIGIVYQIQKFNQQMNYKQKSNAFRIITSYMFNKRSEDQLDKTLTQKLDLLHQQNNLLQQIRQYKQENQTLTEQLINKNIQLQQSNQTVTILSLRINYMITKKFFNTIQNIWQNILYRHYYDAFNGILNQTNLILEQQQSEQIQDYYFYY